MEVDFFVAYIFGEEFVSAPVIDGKSLEIPYNTFPTIILLVFMIMLMEKQSNKILFSNSKFYKFQNLFNIRIYF